VHAMSPGGWCGNRKCPRRKITTDFGRSGQKIVLEERRAPGD